MSLAPAIATATATATAAAVPVQNSTPDQPLAGPTITVGPALFTAKHMELLHHFTSVMANCPQPGSSDGTYYDLTVQYSFSAPYLMDRLLAFAAIHMKVLIGHVY